jgi:hypothetical protein
MTLPQVHTDAKNAQIAAASAIDQTAQSGFDGFRASGEVIEIQQNHGQLETVQALNSI